MIVLISVHQNTIHLIRILCQILYHAHTFLSQDHKLLPRVQLGHLYQFHTMAAEEIGQPITVNRDLLDEEINTARDRDP